MRATKTAKDLVSRKKIRTFAARKVELYQITK